MEIGHIAVGAEGMLDLKLEGGAVVLAVGYKGADADAMLSVSLKPQAFVEKLKAMIPGSIDDVIFDLILAQLSK